MSRRPGVATGKGRWNSDDAGILSKLFEDLSYILPRIYSFECARR
jgi:hypothetical protein